MSEMHTLIDNYNDLVKQKQDIADQMQKCLSDLARFSPLKVGDVVTKQNPMVNDALKKAQIIFVRASVGYDGVRYEYWGLAFNKDGSVGRRKGRLFGTWINENGVSIYDKPTGN